MDVVGRDFKAGDLFIPEVLLCARSRCTPGSKCCARSSPDHGGAAMGKIVIGTVQGDMHDIGKNLVSMMLEGAGFDVTDLGIDTSPAKFVEAVRAQNAQDRRHGSDADDDDAGDENGHRSVGGGRTARQGQSARRRRAGDRRRLPSKSARMRTRRTRRPPSRSRANSLHNATPDRVHPRLSLHAARSNLQATWGHLRLRAVQVLLRRKKHPSQ